MRSKTWRVAVVVGNEEHSPLWEQRARDYWTRQGNVYGLEMSNFTLSFIDDKDAGPCITTFAVVKQVLPGPRVDSMGRMQ